MGLKFPTLAERAVARWRDSHVRITDTAKAWGAFRADEYPVKVWIFPDDSSVEIRGAGKNYHAEACLP